MVRRVAVLISLAWAGVVAFACGAEGDAPSQHRADSSAAAPAGPTGTASITGTVRLAGPPPPNPPIDMRGEPLCRGRYHSEPHQLRVVVDRNQRLANVFVYVKRGLPAGARYPAPADPVTFDQRGCQYQPRVAGIMVGQPLEIRNTDGVPHPIDAVDPTHRHFPIGQAAPGTTIGTTFSHPDLVVRLSCAEHRWMRAYVGVLPHPFFATTDRAGRFAIEGLPPGTYTIESWHEYYGTRRATITVAATAARLDLRYQADSHGSAEF